MNWGLVIVIVIVLWVIYSLATADVSAGPSVCGSHYCP